MKALAVKLWIFEKDFPCTQRCAAVRLQNDIDWKIKISRSVPREVTPIFGYVTWRKPSAKVLYMKYLKTSFTTIASKEM